jgi:molybdenum cofactor cytidylyltransferase
MISAIVLAAGQSKRMGQPKMILPWGDTTVIGKVIKTLLDAGVKDISVITGGHHQEVTQAIHSLPVRIVYNSDFEKGEMISSIITGLKSLEKQTEAALIVLGDQPQIEPEVVEIIVDTFYQRGEKIIVPSYRIHRVHPWFLPRSFWNEIFDLDEGKNMRDYLNRREKDLYYINVDTSSVIQDLDTPDDYGQYLPRW